MENEQMMAVLTELLEDQRKIASAQAETMRIVQQLKIKLEQIEIDLQNSRCDTESGDVNSVQQTPGQRNYRHKIPIDMLRQKPPSNNLRVFFESDAKKWAVILIVAITFLTYLYLFGVHR